MPTHIWLHDDPEGDTESELAPPVKNPGGIVPDPQLSQQQPALGPQSDPFHALVGSHHAQLAQFHAGMAKRAIDPEEAQAHQVAERAHGVASKAHESELEESGKISDMAFRASHKAHEMSRARSFRS